METFWQSEVVIVETNGQQKEEEGGGFRLQCPKFFTCQHQACSFAVLMLYKSSGGNSVPFVKNPLDHHVNHSKSNFQEAFRTKLELTAAEGSSLYQQIRLLRYLSHSAVDKFDGFSQIKNWKKSVCQRLSPWNVSDGQTGDTVPLFPSSC